MGYNKSGIRLKNFAPTRGRSHLRRGLTCYDAQYSLDSQGCGHFYIDQALLYFCFQAGQGIEIAQFAGARRRCAIFGKDASVAWTMELPVSVLPLYDAASVRAGGGQRNNASLVRVPLVAVSAYNITDQRRGREAYGALPQRCQRRHWLPDCSHIRVYIHSGRIILVAARGRSAARSRWRAAIFRHGGPVGCGPNGDPTCAGDQRDGSNGAASHKIAT